MRHSTSRWSGACYPPAPGCTWPGSIGQPLQGAEPIDVLVNHAGTGMIGALESTSMDDAQDSCRRRAPRGFAGCRDRSSQGYGFHDVGRERPSPPR